MSVDPKVRSEVYKRDGYKCRHCLDRNGLHTHHLLYKSQQGEDTSSNLITLCAECHRAHHDGFLKIHFIPLIIHEKNVRFERVKNWKPGR